MKVMMMVMMMVIMLLVAICSCNLLVPCIFPEEYGTSYYVTSQSLWHPLPPNFQVKFWFVLLALIQCYLRHPPLINIIILTCTIIHHHQNWFSKNSCTLPQYPMVGKSWWIVETEIIRGFKRWWEFCWMFSLQWLKNRHICHRTVVHRWLKTNWAQESSSRFEMESRNKSVTDNDFDWSGFVPGNVSFEDPKGVQTAVTLSTYIGLGAPIGNWDITGNSFRHVIKQAITRQGCSLMKSFVICKGFV